MTATTTLSARRFRFGMSPATTTVLAAAGLLWNIYGIVQFSRTAGASAQDLQQMGMSAEQAALYASLPFWMTAVFFIGVAGGTLGSVLIMARSRAATPVLAVSLAAYVALFAGDAALGVFAAFGAGQVAVLGLVVAIAAGLLALARHQARQSADNR